MGKGESEANNERLERATEGQQAEDLTPGDEVAEQVTGGADAVPEGYRPRYQLRLDQAGSLLGKSN